MDLKNLWRQNDADVVRFRSISKFLDFCFRCKITSENSETYYDEGDGYMYLKYPNAVNLW